MVKELENFRSKYPDYNDLDDAKLSDMLAAKYPEAYGDLPAKVKIIPVTPTESKPTNFIDSVVGGLVDKGKKIAGAGEVALAAGTGYGATALSGLSGLLGVAAGDPEGANKAVKDVQEQLTYSPKTETGQKYIQNIAGKFDDWGVTGAMDAKGKKLGGAVMNITDSPALAGVAYGVPHTIAEIISLKTPKFVKQESSGAAKAVTTAVKDKIMDSKVSKALAEAAPEIGELKKASRALYKEVDDTGAVIPKEKYDALVDSIDIATKQGGLYKGNVPRAYKAMQSLKELKGQDVPVSDLMIRRTTASHATKTVDQPEISLGTTIIDRIDNFMEKGADNLKVPEGVDPNTLSKKLVEARDKYGRAKRSETIQTAFKNAELNDAGFDTGLRSELKSILKSRNKSRFFSEDELKLMKDVREGGNLTKLAQLGGSFGFSGSPYHNISHVALGSLIGNAVAGPIGALSAVGLGQLSKALAARMVRNSGEMFDAVIRAGKDGKAITEAYIKNTPKNLRNSAELTELLLKKKADISDLGALKKSDEGISQLIDAAEEGVYRYQPEFNGDKAPLPGSVENMLKKVAKGGK